MITLWLTYLIENNFAELISMSIVVYHSLNCCVLAKLSRTLNYVNLITNEPTLPLECNQKLSRQLLGTVPCLIYFMITHTLYPSSTLYALVMHH